MASISGVSLPFAGGATGSANVRTPAEANTNKDTIQSVTAPQAGSQASKGAANDLTSTQSVSSLLEPKSSEVDNKPRPPEAPSRTDTDSNKDREPVADVTQARTINAVENQLQTARVQQQSTSEVTNRSDRAEAANESEQTSSKASETAQTSTQKAFVSSQTAEKGLGLSINTQG